MHLVIKGLWFLYIVHVKYDICLNKRLGIFFVLKKQHYEVAHKWKVQYKITATKSELGHAISFPTSDKEQLPFRVSLNTQTRKYLFTTL